MIIKRTTKTIFHGIVSANLCLQQSLPLMAQESKLEKDPIDSNPKLVVLSETHESSEVAAPVSMHRKPISPERLKEIAARLPAFSLAPEGHPTFHPIGTTPPPNDMQHQEIPFPPPTGLDNPQPRATQTKAVPLRIVRVSHEGLVDSIKELSVTFSQAMVPLSDLNTIKSIKVPVELKPQPQGNWMWLTERTAVFRSKVAFPKATRYTLTIPAGTESITGGRLDATKTVEILTPSPSVQSFYPCDAVARGLTPVMSANFDQKISPADVITHVTCTDSGDVIQLRLATSSEVDEAFGKGTFKANNEGKTVYLRPVRPFKKDSKIMVVFQPGIRSRENTADTLTNSHEGSQSADSKESTRRAIFNAHDGIATIPSNLKQTFDFRAYGPLKVTSSALHQFQATLDFSNPIKPSSAKLFNIAISPKPKSLKKIVLRDNYIYIDGEFAQATTYTFSGLQNIEDVYGQRLQGKRAVSLEIAKYPPHLRSGYKLHSQLRTRSPIYSLLTLNVDAVNLEIAGARAKDWADYMQWNQSDMTSKGLAESLPHAKIFRSEVIKVNSSFNKWTVTPIDLSECTRAGFSHVVIHASIPHENHLMEWIDISDLAVSTTNTGSDVVALVAGLDNGEPIQGAAVELLHGAARSQTDANGLAQLKGSTAGDDFVVCTYQNSSVISDRTLFMEPQVTSRCEWYGATDRNPYRPGENVSVQGLVRVRPYNNTGLLTPPTNYFESARFTVGQWDKPIASGTVPINTDGSFSFRFKIPQELPTGQQCISLSAECKSKDIQNQMGSAFASVCYFNVEEFRRPEFEVNIKQDKTSVVLGESAKVSTTTAYRSGGALSRAKVSWRVQSEGMNYAPPGWETFKFGRQSQWDSDQEQAVLSPVQPNSTRDKLQGVTDKDGGDVLKIAFTRLNRIEPVRLFVESTVQDLNRQDWSKSVSFILHPASVYPGIKFVSDTGKPFEPWEPLQQDNMTLQLVAVDLNGSAVEGKDFQIKVRKRDDDVVVIGRRKLAVQVDASQKLKCHEVLSTQCKSTSSGCAIKLTALKPGDYQAEVSVRDDQGRENICNTSFTVSEPQAHASRKQNEVKDPEAVAIRSDKDSYKPGDVAHIKVSGIRDQARGVLLVLENNVLRTIPISTKDGAWNIDIGITEASMPILRMDAMLVSNKGAAYKVQRNLSVDTKHHGLKVNISPGSQETRPATETSVSFRVAHLNGTPAKSAHVAVAVVDDNVLALSDFRWDSPLSRFYSDNYHNYTPTDSRVHVFPDYKTMLKMVDKMAFSQETGQLAALSSVDRYGAGGMVGAPVDPRYGQSNEIGNMFQLEPGGDALAFRRPHAELAALPPPSALPPPPAPPTPPGPVTQKVSMRSNMTPLAYFATGIPTDSKGQGHVSFKLPDNVTQYRVLAIAYTDGDFGSGDGTFKTNLPMLVRSTPPRFINKGDAFEIPITIQNNSAAPIEAEVVARAQNLKLIGNGEESVLDTPQGELTGAGVTVPARDRVEVRFKASCDRLADARVQIGTMAGLESDALETTIPMKMPIRDESFAAYGNIDDGIVTQKLSVPHGLAAEIGGLEVQLSSTAMTEMKDSTDYLIRYPYECTEQLSSRVLALLALRRLHKQFPDAKLIDIEAADMDVMTTITKLSERLSYNGFGLWAKDDAPNPYVSLQASRALLMASADGFAVQTNTSQQVSQLLRNMAASWSTGDSSYAITAYGLKVMSMDQSSDAAASVKAYTEQLVDAVNQEAARRFEKGSRWAASDEQSRTKEIYRKLFSLEGLCWLLPVIANDPRYKLQTRAIKQIITENITESGDAAEVHDCWYGEYTYSMFYSNTRAQAVVLEALMESDAQNEVVPKLLKGLMRKRRNGIWLNTQENGYALLAISKYFAVYEKDVPDFVADMWLHDAQAIHQPFKGRSITCDTMRVPMSYLLEHPEDRDVLLTKAGTGRLYYRIGMRYAYADPFVKERNRGIRVTRRYEPVDDPNDVKQLADGSWQVRGGATVRVRIGFETPMTRHYIAMDEPTAAGLEVLNSNLQGTRTAQLDDQSAPVDEKAANAAYFNHTDCRDTGMQAFSDTVAPGNYEFVYYVRATAPGNFIVPPCKIEEMYTPDTFGHTKTDRVIIVSDDK